MNIEAESCTICSIYCCRKGGNENAPKALLCFVSIDMILKTFHTNFHVRAIQLYNWNITLAFVYVYINITIKHLMLQTFAKFMYFPHQNATMPFSTNFEIWTQLSKCLQIENWNKDHLRKCIDHENVTTANMSTVDALCIFYVI